MASKRLWTMYVQTQTCRPIYFLWWPFLRDSSDEMVLEVAVGGEAELIVTHNVKDFAEVEAELEGPNEYDEPETPRVAA